MKTVYLKLSSFYSDYYLMNLRLVGIALSLEEEGSVCNPMPDFYCYNQECNTNQSATHNVSYLHNHAGAALCSLYSCQTWPHHLYFIEMLPSLL